MAAPAEIIAGTELNELAVVATNDFPGVDRGKSRGHLGFGSCQSGGTPRSRWSGSKLKGNLKDTGCGSQGISGVKHARSSHKNQNQSAKTGRKRVRNHE